MQFFQDFNKVKKQQNNLELQDLIQKDGEAQVTQLTQMAQAKISNFEKVYHYLNEEIIHNRASKGMDDIPVYVKEAKNDLDEMLRIIQEMQSIQLLQKTENSKRQQTVQKLKQVFQDSQQKLQKLTDQLLQRQRTSLQSAKQQIKNRHSDNQIDVQLLDEMQYDEEFIQRRNKQISEMGQVIYQLNQMMTDGAKMIKEQGEQIEIIGLNTKSGKKKVEDAVKEVKQHPKFNKEIMEECNIVYKFRLFFCGIITLLVVIIVLLFSAGSKSYPDPNAQQLQTQN